MGAVNRDLTIEQGVTWSAAWHVQLDGADLNPSDGWAARSQVRTNKKAPDPPLWQFNATVDGSVVSLQVLPEESSAWLWTTGVYDVEIYSNAAPPRVVRIVEGRITVDAEVTRASS